MAPESSSEFARHYGPWALVTGAAMGLGAAFARQVAQRGIAVAMLDREEAPLRERARSIAQENGVETHALVADLAVPGFLGAVEAFAHTHEIGLFVSNAALGTVGPFDAIPLEDMIASLDVNCRAPLTLTRALLPGMASRGRGGVILVSSNSGYQGTPFVSHYAATKAYNLVLGEGLWYEMREQGVDVLAFAPGATNTPGFRRGSPKLREGQAPKGIMLPEPTAAAALDALGRTPSARPDWRNRVETFLTTRLLSRRAAIERIGARTRGLRFMRRHEKEAP